MTFFDRLLSRLYAFWSNQAPTQPQEAPVPPEVAKPPRHFQRGACPYCGAGGVILAADGEPHRRWHRCFVAVLRDDNPDLVPEVDPRRDPMVGYVGEVASDVEG